MLPIGTGLGRCDEKLEPLITQHSFPVQMLYGSKTN
jgi:hypothetical protein